LLLAACLAVAPGALTAKDVSLSDCPEPVAAVIREHLKRGKLDEIKMVRSGERTLYIVEIDLAGRLDLKLHITGSGKLLKSVEEISYADLPEAVRETLSGMRFGLSRIGDVDKVVVDGATRYHVEVKRPGRPDLDLVFEEDGSIMSQK